MGRSLVGYLDERWAMVLSVSKVSISFFILAGVKLI